MFDKETYSKQYRKVIFVDTENINACFMESIQYIGEDDLCILPHSQNSFKIDIKYIPIIQKLKTTFTEYNTVNGSPNSMDFCICSELGYMIAMHNAKEYIIISDDTGYKPVVNMWRQRGYNVRLWGRPELLKYKNTAIIAQGEKAKNLVAQLAKEEADQKLAKAEEEKQKTIIEEKIENINLKHCVKTEVTDIINNNTDKHYNNTFLEAKIIGENTNEVHEITNNKTEEIEDKQEEIETNQEKTVEYTVEELAILREAELKRLESEGINHNADILVKYVNIFGASKEKQICKVIYKYKKFKDAESRLAELIKRNREVYMFNIMSNWNLFKHVED